MKRVLMAAVALMLSTTAPAQRGSFNLSTEQSFRSDEQPKIHLYSHNVDALEFRIYRVNDPTKFMTGLKDMHSFGHQEGFDDGEQIDEKTWIEKFHDWKRNLWEDIRWFFRQQFSHEAKKQIVREQSKIERHSRIVSEAEFAQIPILNKSQLVARWRQLVPSTYFSDNNELPLKKMDPGLYLLEATNGHLKAYTVVMVSDVALVVRSTHAGILAMVTDRVSGKPVEGVRVDSGVGQRALATATTDATGVASLAAFTEKGEQDNFYVFATKGAQFAASTPSTWSMTWNPRGDFAGYAFTERPVYRPGHTVHWKAILRERVGNVLQLPKEKQAHVAILDDGGKKLFERDLPINAEGDVSGDYVLPADASLGYYSLQVGAAAAEGDDDSGRITASFHVEDYRKPEYRVMVTAKPKRVLEGATVPVTIDSRYFFGEPVANAKVKYRVYHEQSYGWGADAEDSSPADASASDTEGTEDDAFYQGDEEAEKTGVLDANGTLTVQVPTRVDDKGRTHNDFDYTVEAGVTDAADREITGRGRFTATYGTFHILVEPEKYAMRGGEAIRFKVTAKDYDDKPVSTRVHVQFALEKYVSGKTVRSDGPSTDVHTGADGTATGAMQVDPKDASTIELEGTADAVVQGTRNPTSENSVWVMGAHERAWDEGQGDAQLLSDRKSYAIGDTAHMTLVANDAHTYPLIVVEGDSIVYKQSFHTATKTLEFDVPITATSQPNLFVSALFVKNGTVFQAQKELKVPPRQQQLTVSITPSKDQFEPQQNVGYDVKTVDAAGKPVSADVSFGVVDEAIYSLHPDESGDMVSALYPQRFVSASVDSSLMYAFSGSAGETSPMLAMRNVRYRPQLAQVKPGNEQKPKVRKAFPDTAFWAPSVKTNADGIGHVSFSFPDSLTTWRATVHAVTSDSKAGSAINRVLVRKNLLVRMGTPRFMTQGDEITLPVIAHNYLDSAVDAKVSLNVDGLDVAGGATQTVSLPSKGEGTVLWRLKASRVGTAKLTASAITNVESDALELSFPVNPAGVKLRAAKSGVVSADASESTASVDFPAGTDPMAHALRIEVSPSIAGSMFSALDDLTSFPYGCTEQTMSSFLPDVIVADTLQKLKVAGRINERDLNEKMFAGLQRLLDYQHQDGGWGWWKEDDSRVYMTAYVVGGLGQAKQAGKLPNTYLSMMYSGRRYLLKVVAEHPKMRPELRAAVLYALAMSGDSNDMRTALDAEYDRRNDLEPQALAMTGLAMLQVKDARAGELAALLQTKAIRQGSLAHWEGSYAPLVDLSYDNSVEATAFAMRLLARVNANDPLLPDAAQWLMLERNGGVWWSSTEQTAMVIFGLADYLAATHELDADFTADVLVNGASAGTHHFTQADVLSGSSFVVNLDAAHLKQNANSVQVVRRGGAGRIYWSAVGTFYSTAKKDYQAGTIGLNLTRDYYTLSPTQKDGKVVYALKPFSGTAQVGDVLAVHEAIAGSPERYLLLEDPIPAGAEFVTNTGSYPMESRPDGWSEWYTRREFHDDHAAFFAEDFDRRQEIFYLLRIVNPGTFTVSPASVEPMYQPGIRATTDTMRMNVPATQGVQP